MSHRCRTVSPERPLRSAFTLIELVLVVILIGLVYGLAIDGIKKSGEPARRLTLHTLVDFMTTQHRHNRLSLVCTDRCRTCTLYADGNATKRVEAFLDDSAQYYRFDHYLGSETLTWTPLFDENGREEPVCFRYDLLPDGSRSEMLVEYGGEVFDLGGPFSPTAVYASLHEAVDARQRLDEEIVR